MTRIVAVAAAQLGPTGRHDSRASVVKRHNKETMFNFALNREPQAYGLITEWKGAKAPAEDAKPIAEPLAGKAAAE